MGGGTKGGHRRLGRMVVDSEQLQGHVRWMLTLTPMVSVMEWQWVMGWWPGGRRCLGRSGGSGGRAVKGEGGECGTPASC